MDSELLIGPLYPDSPGLASVVIELPYGITQPAAENFHLLLDGGPEFRYTAHQVKSFLDSGKVLAILLCIDVSGTMAGAPLKQIKDDLSELTAKRKLMRFAVMTFGTDGPGIERIVGFEEHDDPQKLTDAINGLKAGGSKSQTRLYDTLHEGLDYYESINKPTALPARKRILVISDGKDEGSSVSSGGVKARSLELGIPIDTIQLGKIDPEYGHSLEDLAGATGGHFVQIPVQSDLKKALTSLRRELTETQTIVAYFKGLPDTETGKYTDTIEIQLQQPNGRPLSQSLKAQLPLPSPPPKPDGRFWLWLLIGLLTLFFLIVLFIFFRRRRIEEEPSSVLPNRDVDMSPSDIFVDPSPPKHTHYQIIPPASERRTQVSGYFPGPGPGQPAAILVGVSGVAKGRRYSVERDFFRFGADPDNDVLLGDDEYVSSHHAHLRYEKGSLLLADQGSRNGTFLNDQRVGEVPLVISPGDHIRVGDSTFEVMAAPGR
jgi:hypothetical protein